MMHHSLEKYIFELPPELIAQKPLPKRDTSRMMVVDRRTGAISHSHTNAITHFLKKGDLIVLNNTKVMHCRVMGQRKSGGIVEMLFIKEHSKSPLIWEVMLKPLRRIKKGEHIQIFSSNCTAILQEKLSSGRALMQLNIDISINDFFQKYGLPPLPPYIKRDYTKYDDRTLMEDKERYQTVYAESIGSVAAPTAGLHFSENLLNNIRENGINITKITLHVGPGTFIPISTQNIARHKMEAECYEIPEEAAIAINQAKREGKKVIAVGSTVVRTLETAGKEHGEITPSSGKTDLFIYPPFDFKIVDGMLTNFHLPGSTLIVMVCAFAGYELIMQAYKEAIKEKYRFFSFGDCMLIL